MQVDVRQQGRHGCPLWRSFPTCRPATRFHYPCAQPFSNEAQNPFVRYPVLDELQQPLMVEGVEETSNVRIEHKAHPLAHDGRPECIQRIVLSSSGPKPVRE